MNPAYCRLAVTTALKSPSRFRLGAVLVKRRQVLSVGYNIMHKTHPAMERYNRDKSWTPGLHAEVHACLGVSWKDLNGATLYVARVKRNGLLALARPCIICATYLEVAGIRKVYYTDDNYWNIKGWVE